ncbi:hypothetical protein [Desulfogranum japonicum]|uniref:hypothetical protein n=1 Tax=Desulfogranum japonicum TaxID=231447 RepID=UPI00048F9834|nr:hypothetical protein [Desulfogranum japonicum]
MQREYLILLGPQFSPVMSSEPPVWLPMLLGIVSGTMVSYLLYKLIPGFLKRDDKSEISLLRYYLTGIVIAYFLLVPVCGAAAYLAVKYLGNINHHEASVFIFLMAIWFPLWWFCPVGLSIGWIFYKQKIMKV